MKNVNVILKKVFKNKMFLVIFLVASCKRAAIYKHKDKISSVVLKKIDSGEEISDDEIIENLNEQDDRGKTLLMLAVEKKNIELVARLISLGADLDIKDKDSNTALMLAVKDGNKEAVKILLPSPEIKAVDKYERSKIVFDEESLHFFSANTGVKTEDEAACPKSAVSEHKGRISSVLLEKIDSGEEVSDDEIIENLNEQDDRGKTLLILAVEKKNIELVARLISLGADLDIKDKDGNTALMLAVKDGNKEAVEILLPSPEIKAVDKYERSKIVFDEESLHFIYFSANTGTALATEEELDVEDEGETAPMHVEEESEK